MEWASLAKTSEAAWDLEGNHVRDDVSGVPYKHQHILSAMVTLDEMIEGESSVYQIANKYHE